MFRTVDDNWKERSGWRDTLVRGLLAAVITGALVAGLVLAIY